MVQGFVFPYPANNSGLVSAIVRTNLSAIGSMNSGDTAPTNPQTGMPWLDTSRFTTYGELTLKTWSGSAWVILVEYPASSYSEMVRFTVSTPAVSWTLAHSLGKANVTVQVFDASGFLVTPLSVDVSNTNTVTVTHAFAIAGSAIVLG